MLFSANPPQKGRGNVAESGDFRSGHSTGTSGSKSRGNSPSDANQSKSGDTKVGHSSAPPTSKTAISSTIMESADIKAIATAGKKSGVR